MKWAASDLFKRETWWGPLSLAGLVVAILAFASDRLHKWWMLFQYDMPEKVRVEVTGFFDLVMAWNKGVSYGLFQAEGTGGVVLLILFALLVVGGLSLWLARVAHWRMALAIGLVIGGALGNVYDRFVYGAVADFFSFHAWGYYWYIFNVADIWIVLGVVLIFLDSMLESGEEKAAAGRGDGERG